MALTKRELISMLEDKNIPDNAKVLVQVLEFCGKANSIEYIEETKEIVIGD